MNMHDTRPACADAALAYAARGWHVFPVPPGSKKSHKAAEHSDGRAWGATTDPAEIARDWSRWPQANVGIVTGPKSGLLVIEADTEAGHGIDGIGNMAALIEEHGPLPDTIEALSPSGSWHIYFRWPEGWNIINSAGQIAPGIDVRADGGMVVGVPSVKPGVAAPYRWKNPPPLFDLGDCPEWLLRLAAKPERKLSERAMPGGRIDTGGTRWADAALRDEIAAVLAAPEGARNDALNTAAFNLGQIVAGGGLAEDMVVARLTAAAEGAGLETGEITATIKSGLDAGAKSPRGPKEKPAGQQPEAAPEARPFDDILADAQALTPDDLDRIEEITAEAARLSSVRQDQVFRAIKAATGIGLTTLRQQVKAEAGPEPDHLDFARAAISRMGRDNVLCAGPFVWRWDACGVWRQQDDRAIKQVVQAVIDGEEADVTATLVNGVSDVLKSEIFKPDHEFNRGNPECVNCPSGEIELQAGQWVLRPHRREHYRTTQIPVPYDPAADAPMFGAFLGQVFRDDPDRADKIKAVLELIGYTLMSHARHERFIMLIGPGANGKSVLLAVLEALCGTGNVAGVQPSKFHEKFQRAHLHQKLANIVTELKQGEVIADAELKAITSGEPATVEHKFKDPFVMRPFATCWFGTNHMPHTRDFSEALFRRATILQFNRTFTTEEQDPTLKDKLCTELPGILNMALGAYARAVAEGFTAPASSEDAKREWRLEADQVAQFVDDACQRDPAGRVASREVFQRYRQWADQNGIARTMSQKGLRDRLTRLGFGADKDRYGRYVLGLRIMP